MLKAHQKPMKRHVLSAFLSTLPQKLAVVAAFVAMVLVLGLANSFGRPRPSRPLYLDPNEPIEVRVNDLLGRMTLLEKVGQLNMPDVYGDTLGKTPAEKMMAAKQFVAGTYDNGIGPGSGFYSLAINHRFDSFADRAAFFNELQKIALTKTRLKIPLLETEEGPHGAQFPGATVFPEGLAIGSTFDMPLVRAIYAAAAEEARAVGVNMLSTLVLEADRDPRMGRNMEGYTEDPYLYSRIAANIVKGAQGSNVAAPDKVVTVLTDFPTQSQPASGMERGAIELSERSIRENFLPPWVAAIKAGTLGVMAGYPEIDDIPEHSSRKWNTTILRQELGFRGVVLSEGDGFDSLIYEHIVPNQSQAGALALWAGVDMDITNEPAYMGPLVQNVKDGMVSEALLDRAVRRVLRVKFELGLFDHPYVDPARAMQVVHSLPHQKLALRAAEEGIVLLKNDNNLLPLKKNLKSIAVIGPDANNGWRQLGDYPPPIVPQEVTTIFDGIRQEVSPETQVRYFKGCDVIGGKPDFAPAIAAARQANVAVVVLGENPHNQGSGVVPPTDGEGFDVASLDLTGDQESLLKAVQATGTPTILVLINGRPLSTRWAAANIPAIVEAWEPGERGGQAVADVLFGDYDPSGRLPITIPRSIGQFPSYYDYKPSKQYWIHSGWSHDGGYVDMRATPLYPFGYGLSYTHFKFSNLQISPSQIYQAGTATVSVDVTNTGTRPGVETVELYTHERYTPVATPVKQLKGFSRVALSPGETKTVTMSLTPKDLMLLDRRMRWVVVPGTFDIMIGKSSADIVLSQPLQVRTTDPLNMHGLSIDLSGQ